ncbi:MAG TPA: hypothetical protein VNN06_06980, partial [Ramlibacter sp.]|nr:hypothetical protein [Ramlibacter sp.]
MEPSSYDQLQDAQGFLGRGDTRELSGSIRISSISTSMRKTHPHITVESGISYSGTLKRRVVEGDIRTWKSGSSTARTHTGQSGSSRISAGLSHQHSAQPI